MPKLFKGKTCSILFLCHQSLSSPIMASPLKLDKYDIIICGGGTAGCVLAARLTEDARLTVVLLEAGEDANDDFRISTPGLFPLVVHNPERDWQFISEPSPGLNDRKTGFSRGKCLGGSPAINLMALIYPSKRCLDAWSSLGNTGWDWDAMAPYYRKFQRHCLSSRDVEEALSIDFLDPKVQGIDGPICSSYPPMHDPLQKAWVDTWKGLQKSITGDPLTGVHIGGYTSPASIDPDTAQRSHAGTAYYASVAHRTNLHVVTGAMIERIELDAQELDAVVATGVTFTHAGTKYTAHASREIILSAGTIGSPCILERSGIGSQSHCKEVSIKNIIDNSNVGENLQDHLTCGLSFEVKDGVATADMMRDPAVIEKAMEQYKTSRSGPLASGAGHNFAYTPLTDFINPRQSQEDIRALLEKYLPPKLSPEYPSQVQHEAFVRHILLSPREASSTLCFINIQVAGHKLHPKDVFSIHEPENYMTMMPQIAYPLSRGSVHIQSTDPNVHPKIEPNYLSHPLDAEIMARHMMQAESIIESPPLRHFLKSNGRRLPDGQDAQTLRRAIELIRHSGTTNYHPVGTCAMMPKDLGGVVDSRLKVYGTSNLRVCDASIFPIQVRRNIQSTVYAVAEKGSDIMKENLAEKMRSSVTGAKIDGAEPEARL